MKFEVGKLHILTEAETTMWGNALLAESTDGSIRPIGKDETNAINYVEILEEKWLENFNKKEK